MFISQQNGRLATSLANVAVEIGSVGTNIGINAGRSFAAEVGQITKTAIGLSDDLGRAGATTAADGTVYSVAYEMKLADSSYPGIYHGSHFFGS